MSSPRKAPSQLALFEPPRLVRPEQTFDFARCKRIELDATSWIEHIPRWYARHEQLFDELATLPTWERRSRWMFTRHVDEPRLTAEFANIDDAPRDVRQMAALFLQRYNVQYDSVWMNFYRDHRDSTAWHGDWGSCKRAVCTVPVLSLGATRRFLIRPKEGGTSTVFTVESGDLVVMGGRCQKDWVHAVPKESRPSGGRISINFGSSAQNTPD